MVEVNMIEPQKLEQVGVACEAIQEAAEKVRDLHDDEPCDPTKVRPSTLRAVELRHVIQRLEEQRAIIQALWS